MLLLIVLSIICVIGSSKDMIDTDIRRSMVQFLIDDANSS